jgi:hypothetical protein
MDTLIALIGIAAARNLAVIYGGTRFYFSESPHCLLRLTVMMSEESARKLIAEFKGATIEIPLYADAIKKERNEEMRADQDSGMSIREIALKHEITERGARMILNNAISTQGKQP